MVNFLMDKVYDSHLKAAKYTKKITVFATEGDRKGEIDLIWQPVPGAASYMIQVRTGKSLESRWKEIDIVSRSRYTSAGLKSRTTYSFRIAPLGTKGITIWSEPVIQKAP